MSVAAPGEVPGWEQISGLRARLSPQARIHRHRYRGQIWHVVHDRAAARFYRFGPGVFAFVAGLDGRATLEEVRISLETQLHDQAPEPQELVQLVAQLRGADLLVFDRPADAAALYERWDLERRSQWRSRLLRPLALRFPLVDPQPLLDLGARFVRPVFTLPGLMVWAAVVLAGGVLALSQGAALTEHAASRMLDPKNLLLLWLAYPVIKALHELGHGFAVKSWGGEVHEMGVMLLVLMPVPYVDASAASAFVNKRHRMAVGAAGILVETFIAAVALFVWSEAEPGTVRDLAFNVALIGGVSTLLFNGNPLLRFDGYYVLSDAIEIPNLAQRATRYYAYLAKHYLLGLADAASPVSAPGERPWFAFYAPAALIYRLGILVIIALYIADKLLALGVLLAVWAIAAQVLLPIGRQVHYVLSSPELIGRRRRALAITLVTAVALGATLHLAQLPAWTLAEGYVRLPERSLVRADVEGFVIGVTGPVGGRVLVGEPLFELDDPALRTQIEALEWRRRELEVRRRRALMTDRSQAGLLAESLAEVDAEIEQAHARRDSLVVRSPSNGIFTVSRAADLPGRLVRKGDLLGYVVDAADAVARVVVPQARIDRVRREAGRIEVRLAGEVLPGDIVKQVPAATMELPSSVLGSQAGGDIAVDARDEQGLRAIEPVFELDIALPRPELVARLIGARVSVRIEHQREPLTRRVHRALRSLLLERLGF